MFSRAGTASDLCVCDPSWAFTAEDAGAFKDSSTYSYTRIEGYLGEQWSAKWTDNKGYIVDAEGAPAVPKCDSLPSSATWKTTLWTIELANMRMTCEVCFDLDGLPTGIEGESAKVIYFTAVLACIGIGYAFLFALVLEDALPRVATVDAEPVSDSDLLWRRTGKRPSSKTAPADAGPIIVARNPQDPTLEA